MFATFVLDEDYTPVSLKDLLILTADFDRVATYRLYAEAGNNGGDATHSCARMGGSDVSCLNDAPKGMPLFPGIPPQPPRDLDPSRVGRCRYDFSEIYVSGKSEDTFQIQYDIV